MNLCLGCMQEMPEENEICPFCGHVSGETVPDALCEGSILGNRYIAGKVLSANALQTKYLGWDAVEGKKVIIKEFFPRMMAVRGSGGEMIVSEEYSKQYLLAVQSLSNEYSLQQRFRGMGCIADLEATMQTNNTIYAVIEFLEGVTLEETFRSSIVAFASAKEVISRLAKTLAPLHKMGVVHCNICPSNVMITNDGAVKLLDFGSTQYKIGMGRSELEGILKMGYAPAELSSAQSAIAPTTDVYSLAALMYKMLTGITPQSAIERMENDKLLSPSQAAKIKIEQGAENAIMNALSVYPDQRTESVDAFLAQLQNPGTQRIKVTKKDRDGGKVPLWLKIATPILAAVVAAFLLLFITNSNNKMSFGSFFTREAYVPNLINMSDTDAEKSLKKSRLSMVITGQQNSEIVPKGMVLGQNPAAGTLLEKGGTVGILMSAGPEEIVDKDKMPYVLYLTEAKARETLAALDIAINITYEESEKVQKGLVISQSVAEGTDVDANTTVTLTVSLGAPEKEQPKKKNNTSNNHTNKNTQPVPTAVPTVTPAPQEVIEEAKMQGMQPKPEDNKQGGLKQGGGNQTQTKESAPVMSQSIAKPTAVPTVTQAPQEKTEEVKTQGLQQKPEEKKPSESDRDGGNQTPTESQTQTPEANPQHELKKDGENQTLNKTSIPDVPESTGEPAPEGFDMQAGTGGFSLKAVGE